MSKESHKTTNNSGISESYKDCDDLKLHRKKLHWIYTAGVRSGITYEAVIWTNRTDLSTKARALYKLQRLVFVYISKAIRTCATVILEVD